MLPAHAMPLHGLIGGLMIGSAAAINLLGLGRIAGVSGLAARSLGLADGPPWSLAASFILGLPLGAWLVDLVAGPITLNFAPAALMLVVGGMLVGFGTRLGGGCTGGHGVCGLSRLSPRSLTATAIFMAAGVVAVALVNRIGLGW